MKIKKLLIAMVCGIAIAATFSSCTPHVADAIIDAILDDGPPPPGHGGPGGHGPGGHHDGPGRH